MISLQGLWARHCVVCDAIAPARVCRECVATWAVARLDLRLDGVRAVAALCAYDSATGDCLRRAKYGADRESFSALAVPFAAHVGPWLAGTVDAVVPVPSPWPRRLRRGFAPASVLGRALAGWLRRPLVHALAIRPGRASAGLSSDRRRINLRGRVHSTIPVPGRIVLVDDVITTGATAEACGRELLGDAARSVVVAALCATERRDGALHRDTP